MHNFTDVFAVPGHHNIVDTINPVTDRSSIQGETLDEVRQRYPNAERFTWDAWRASQITRQNTPIAWLPTAASEYDAMLNVLPPACHRAIGFLVGEPMDHSYETGQPRFQAYLSRNGEHFVSSRPLTIAEFRTIR